MSSSVTPVSRPGMESIGGTRGGYAGANDMANNGLSANQNQVQLNYIIRLKIFILLRKDYSVIGIYSPSSQSTCDKHFP